MLFELTVQLVLRSMLEILTKVDNKLLKNPIIEIIRILCSGMEDSSYLSGTVRTQISDFVTENLPFDHERVFLTLNVINMLNKALITQILVFISEQIDKVEIQRGVGRDSKLRSLFENLKNRNLD